MNRLILIIWFLPLVFMGIAFYILVNSSAPVGAKVVFSVIPFLIWVLGGIAIYREYREQGREHHKEEEILQEAKRILNAKNHHEEKK
jgi:cytochrome c-type biogenesis protein CcmH/NrfF